MNEVCDHIEKRNLYLEKKNLKDYYENVITFKNDDDNGNNILADWLKNTHTLAKFDDLTTTLQPMTLVYDISKVYITPFSETIFATATIELPNDIIEKAYQIANTLNVSDEVKEDINKLLQQLYVSGADKSFTISMSSDSEFLIYEELNGTFKNLLINEDGDIELLVIPPDRTKSYNKIFYKEDGINFSKVVRTFNEMH